MEVSYKRRFSQSYMILQGQPEPEEIYELTVLNFNRIQGLLPVETEIADGRVCFWYDITGKQSLMDYLERKQADRQLLLQLFQALEQISRELPVYLLTERHILLEEEYIYLEPVNHKIEFVYLPGRRGDIRDSFRGLMELLLRRLNHSDKRGADMAYEMYQLSLQKEQSFMDMVRQAASADRSDTAEEKNRQPDAHAAPEPAGKQEIAGMPETAGKTDSRNSGKRSGWRKNRSSRNKKQEEFSSASVADYAAGENYAVREEEDTHPTEVLGCQNGVRGILRYQGHDGQPDIRIDKPVCLIGKAAGEADGCIEEKSVSRVHARIVQEEGNYFLEDMNSTNGTFVNGEQLEYRQKVKLEPDRVTFSRTEYIFG